MEVSQLMTRKIVSVAPETAVADIATLLVERRLSAVPVIDPAGHVIGIVSEGDLMRRPEIGTERRRSWWLHAFTAPDTLAAHYIKSHGLRAKDVMTHPVITIGPEASLGEAADLMERRRVKRLPVTRGDRLEGVIARSDLIRALAAAQPTIAFGEDDAVIRKRLEDALEQESWVPWEDIYVTVLGRTAHLWGTVRSETQLEAVELLARGIAGIERVVNHLAVEPSSARGPLMIP